MLAGAGATSLLQKVNHIGQSIEQTLGFAQELSTDADGDVARWLECVLQALRKAELDCAEAQFCARELRAASPSPETIQPRLL
ncbi:MAG: hypothetical protein EBQ56_17930 [Proteobacteria bacterium]|jgi:hypothetical protein|nr:hypothetical protein [Chloroflexota bacterium]NBQ32387.1 hypothetical protein [Pseudomonadota bacterium]MCX5989587.1 hypothetical protein [Chloroflexota bacterium]NBQ62495.1 hypothetical protein [Pseudomonadota bacterium]NBT02798.1 hypothetical protein [Pseudomonadota bacterium]